MKELIKRYPYAVFLALDLLVSALSFGDAWQALSARFAKGREQHDTIATFLANATDFVARALFHQPRHCDASLDAYIARGAAAAVKG